MALEINGFLSQCCIDSNVGGNTGNIARHNDGEPFQVTTKMNFP